MAVNGVMPETQDDIYSARILELAADINHVGHLPKPMAQARAVSKLCGSMVEAEINMREGKISEFAQEVRACVLGQAACSVMAKHIIGAEEAELRELAHTMRAMLKEGGTPPAGKWAELAALQPVRDYPARHASTLLIFDAVESCLDAVGKQAKD